MHVQFARAACNCILDLHLQSTSGTLLYVRVTTLIATLAASEAEGARRVDDTAAASRLADGLRARFRRGSHRLGTDPQRQWTMTPAPTQGSTLLRSTIGRHEGEARQRERNPLPWQVGHGVASWNAI